MRLVGGRSVTGVHGSVMGAQKCSSKAQTYIYLGQGSAAGGQRSVTEAWPDVQKGP